jgi:phage terminase large subunit-like protein
MTDEFARLLEEAEAKEQTTKASFFNPTPRQQEFFILGATCRERQLRAGNQLGKSEAGAFETACHLTGIYPPWWKGRRFTKPIRAWAAGESAMSTRNILQSKLLGQPGVEAAWGTGMIPKQYIVDRSLGHGASDAVDTLQVRHHTNGMFDGISTIQFLSFEMGRPKFQGEPVDWILVDEEPPPESGIWGECIARLGATQGSIVNTMTPLRGRTPLISRFDREKAPGRGLVKMTIYDCVGYLPNLPNREAADAIVAGYEAHMRDARANGEPYLGAGAVFPIQWEDVIFDPSALSPALLAQSHKLWGLDFGINHPFAAVLIGWDKDADMIFVLDGFRVDQQTPIQHVPRIRSICSLAPVAWPHDGHDRDRGSGVSLIERYRQPLPGMPGLNVLPDHAQFEEGGYSTESGVAEMLQRFMTGRLKISRHLIELLDELRDYHRDRGLIVKINDDMVSALRIAIMDRRHAKVVALGDRPDRSQRGHWRDVPDQQPQEWDIFSGQVIGPERPRLREFVGPVPPRPSWIDR